MLSVTINSKKHNIPTGWHEVTWSQYLKLIKPLKLTEIISIFTGIPVKKLSNSRITGLESIIIALNFIGEGMNIPENTTKLGKFILPKDITLQTIDQYFMLQAEIEKMSVHEDIVERTKYLANFASIYCHALNEEFDYEKSIELAKEFDSYSCIEVLAAGSFFLSKLISIDKHLPMSYLLTLTRWKKLRQDTKILTKRSDRMLRSTRSRATSKKMTKR